MMLLRCVTVLNEAGCGRIVHKRVKAENSDMDFIRRFLVLFFPLTCHVCVAVASPTSNEFLPCHQMASSVLLHCLDEKPGYSADNCWDSARKVNDTCYA